MQPDHPDHTDHPAVAAVAAAADVADVAARADAALPGLIDELATLVAIPSVAFPEFPSEPVHRMADAVVDLLRRSGATNARLLDIPDGYPAVWADLPAPPGAPTVLLYAHYDVQPAPPEQGWTTDPFTPTFGADGRLYGRGAADDKSGVIIHAGTLQLLGEHPPVGIKILVEGEEETDSHLDAFVEANPELFDCDAFVIADMGNQEVGTPALTTALRGGVVCTVTVRTLDFPCHSGVFGGAAPDALIALVRILATLHDDAGNTAVAGLTGGDWPGADLDEQVFRTSAGVRLGVGLVGTGTLASRLWARPSVTVIGLDAPRVATASNVLIPQASAKVSMRIPPGTDPERELTVLMDHLRAAAPWGVDVEVQRVGTGRPFAVDMDRPGIRIAEQALRDAFGTGVEPGEPGVERIGSGGSIPLVSLLKQASPRADVILWGAEDMARSRIHASDESVDPAEIRAMIIAQTLTLHRLAGQSAAAGPRDARDG